MDWIPSEYDNIHIWGVLVGRNPTLPFGVFRRFPLIVVYCSDSERTYASFATSHLLQTNLYVSADARASLITGYKEPVAIKPLF